MFDRRVCLRCPPIAVLCLIGLLFLSDYPAESQQEDALTVLFIGNSVTYYNQMPLWVSEISKSLNSAPVVKTKDVSKANARLSGHLISTAYGNALDAIRKGSWKIVVLQGYSSELLDEPDQFQAAIQGFVQEIRAKGGEPVLFQTYSPAPGHRRYERESELGGNPAEMQKRISAAYAKIADQTGVRTARVGDAFQWVTASNPEIHLFDADLEHPSACGSYLIACIFVSLITGKDLELSNWIPSKGVTPDEAKILRTVSKRFVGN